MAVHRLGTLGIGKLRGSVGDAALRGPVESADGEGAWMTPIEVTALLDMCRIFGIGL